MTQRPPEPSVRITAGPEGRVTVTEEPGLSPAQLREATEILAGRAEATAVRWFDEFTRTHGLEVRIARTRDGKAHARIRDAEYKESLHSRVLRPAWGTGVTRQAALADLIARISDGVLVMDATSDRRRVIPVPRH